MTKKLLHHPAVIATSLEGKSSTSIAHNEAIIRRPPYSSAIHRNNKEKGYSFIFCFPISISPPPTKTHHLNFPKSKQKQFLIEFHLCINFARGIGVVERKQSSTKNILSKMAHIILNSSYDQK